MSANLVWPQFVGFITMAMVVGGSYSIWDEKAVSREASWETIDTIG